MRQNLGDALVAVPSFILLLLGWSLPTWPEDERHALAADIWDAEPEALAAEIEAYRGGWLDQMPHRAETATVRFTTVLALEYGWRVLGLMLVGMALYHWGFLTAERSKTDYAIFVAGWEFAYAFPFGNQYNYWGSMLVSGGWIGLVMLACKAEVLPRVTSAVAAVGRTALSNYLLQTALCTFVFYGFGLGAYGSFDRVQQLSIVGGVWAIELIVSPLWLKRYRFGPFEWLWLGNSSFPRGSLPAEVPRFVAYTFRSLSFRSSFHTRR